MNSKQISKKSMFVRVDVFLIAKTAILSTLPNYSLFYALFKENLNILNTLSQEQMLNKSGFVKTKKRLKLVLAGLSFDASRKLQAYATFTNNDVLFGEINFTESELKYASNDELMKCAQAIHDRAQSHLADLADYGITEDTLTTLLSGLNAFEASIPKASIEKAARKENTARIAAVIKKIEEALMKIDVAIEIVRLKEPIFYNEYKNLRKLVETGRGTIALKGNITDAETKEPIKNAKIVFTIKLNGSMLVPGINRSIVKTSATKGGFYIKSMPDGIYDVVVTKNGYAEQKTTVAITNGEMARLEVELVKS